MLRPRRGNQSGRGGGYLIEELEAARPGTCHGRGRAARVPTAELLFVEVWTGVATSGGEGSLIFSFYL
jgi:hypothetical protein